MKAALLKAPSRSEVEGILQPVSGPEDMRARMKYCGVCEDALHIHRSLLTPPGNLTGREWGGRVVELGCGTGQWSVSGLGIPKSLTAAIEHFQARLTNEGPAASAAPAVINRDIDAEVTAAQWVIKSPCPAPQEESTDVYVYP